MIRLIEFIKPYAPYMLIAWASFIIILSSTPGLPALKIKIQNAGSEIRLDYLIHFFEYGVLSFLSFLSFIKNDLRADLKKLLLLTAGLFIFAVLDELHQKIIPGRTFNPKDLLCNLSGILAALLFYIWISRINQKVC